MAEYGASQEAYILQELPAFTRELRWQDPYGLQPRQGTRNSRSQLRHQKKFLLLEGSVGEQGPIAGVLLRGECRQSRLRLGETTSMRASCWKFFRLMRKLDPPSECHVSVRAGRIGMVVDVGRRRGGWGERRPHSWPDLPRATLVFFAMWRGILGLP